LYFDNNNLPVGSGPLPPKVGQKTSLKVYWTLGNNLHQLNNVSVAFNLPLGVEFDGQSRADNGSVYYDAQNRQIIWRLDTWPTNVYSLKAEFNIALTPQASDRNRIMILSTGSVATAIDSETQSQILKTVKAQTTKLDDDDIATLNNDGRVQ